MEFTKELKKDWITALESGDYKKTETGDLYNKGCYCALGVLCMVSGIVKEGEDLVYDYEVKPYLQMEQVLTLSQVRDVYRASDNNEGDNFKAAIEVIKDLQTIN